MNKRIALVELHDSHDECLLSQLYALKNAGCHVTLICTERVNARNPFFLPYVDVLETIELTGDAWGDFNKMRRLIHYFRREKIEKVVFNTAQGGNVRNLCLLAPKEIEFIGIIHTLNKFRGSFTQRIIDRKIRKYFVLNGHFLTQIPPRKGRSVTSFYPLRFPAFQVELEKPHGELWIGVIGGVENRRKDLLGSVELIAQLPDHVKVFFLGKSDPKHENSADFLSALAKKGMNSRVKIFDHFVAAEEFDAHLRKMDLIWTMIHPETTCAQEYFSNQIPGGLNIALAYGIPMLNHAYYVKEWEDLKYSIGYTLDTFKEDFENGTKGIDILRSEMKSVPRFTAVFQEKSYLDLLFQH
ncbi:MAG: hypothetical protein ACK45H_03325 [Bacteroidota bacterium]|jgi:hypothetical protein